MCKTILCEYFDGIFTNVIQKSKNAVITFIQFSAKIHRMKSIESEEESGFKKLNACCEWVKQSIVLRFCVGKCHTFVVVAIDSSILLDFGWISLVHQFCWFINSIVFAYLYFRDY